MQKYGVNELRRMFLEFFESKGHLAMKSFSLVPHNDKSLLLINSGMAPLKPYFTGQEIPPCKRVTTCQKCIRTGDIENVGKTARHGTFFEMLGNFSFGDYFKKESIAWTWEFLTEVVGLDPDRLYPSVYLEDDEAWEIWNKDIGIPAERIFRFGKEDNFWEHGSGPCGPCSEVYYDRGEAYGCGKPDCTVGCDCDRYMEIWNNVFTQFDNDGNNNYTELEQKNIDTGMGLERLACIVQDVDSMFDVDTIKELREHVSRLADAEYGKEYDTDVSIRVITDHIRSVTFMISDGIMPSNEGRGYVLRRLLRRACRHGRLLAIQGKFLTKLAQTVIDGSKDGYPELEEKKDFILKVIDKEEDQFNKTIDQGLSILSEMEAELEKKGEKTLSGEMAFKLYDTYGFPLELTMEIAEESGYTVDKDGFDAEMQQQRERARAARGDAESMGSQSIDLMEFTQESSFIGYDVRHTSAKVIALFQDAVFDTTVFYAESGGQVGDSGTICAEGVQAVVDTTIKAPHKQHLSHVIIKEGELRVGDAVKLQVDEKKRDIITSNHSCTHLLQSALKQIVGSHIQQAGSFVSEEYLRFDFTHFEKVNEEQLKEIERLVNRYISGHYARWKCRLRKQRKAERPHCLMKNTEMLSALSAWEMFPRNSAAAVM